jgi:hypothetical protein
MCFVYCILRSIKIRNILNLQITIVDLSIKIFLRIILFILVFEFIITALTNTKTQIIKLLF